MTDTSNAAAPSATIMLCDYAQVAEGKLTIVGGGWNEMHTIGSPTSVAVLLEMPWNATEREHSVLLELIDEDGHPVIDTASGTPVRVEAGLHIESGNQHPLGRGVPATVPFACMFGPLPVQPGKRYVWQLSIDGTGRPEWRASFLVSPEL